MKVLKIAFSALFVSAIIIIMAYTSTKISDLDFSGKIKAQLGLPAVHWETASPEQQGMNSARLTNLRNNLAEHATTAFLVVRGGKLIYEWYAQGSGPNHPHYTAAMAKALTGITTLLVCLSDGTLHLDDTLAEFVPAIENDTQRSSITIEELAFHKAGIDDVDFYQGKAGKLHGWKKEYYDHPASRFMFAVQKDPILFNPGSAEKYSGIGYYALAYAVSKSLQHTPYKNIKNLLHERIMRPLGIPGNQWLLSYGDSYKIDGMRLYAFGSGLTITARATAKIAELMLQQGRWKNQQLIDPKWIDKILAKDRSANKPPVSTNHGWILNLDKKWPSLPTDAYAGIGGGNQITLIIPSLDLIMVRYGERLSSIPGTQADIVDQTLFKPFINSITGTNLDSTQPS